MGHRYPVIPAGRPLKYADSRVIKRAVSKSWRKPRSGTSRQQYRSSSKVRLGSGQFSNRNHKQDTGQNTKI